MDRIENVTGDDGRSAETVRQRIEAVQQVSTFLNEWIPVVKKCAYGVALQLIVRFARLASSTALNLENPNPLILRFAANLRMSWGLAARSRA